MSSDHPAKPRKRFKIKKKLRILSEPEKVELSVPNFRAYLEKQIFVLKFKQIGEAMSKKKCLRTLLY